MFAKEAILLSRERENILQGRFTEILPDSLAPKAAWLLRKTEVLTAAKLLAPARCHSCYRNSWEPPKLALLILGFSSSLSHASWWFLHATPFSAIELPTACARTFGAGRAEPYRKAKTLEHFLPALWLSVAVMHKQPCKLVPDPLWMWGCLWGCLFPSGALGAAHSLATSFGPAAVQLPTCRGASNSTTRMCSAGLPPLMLVVSSPQMPWGKYLGSSNCTYCTSLWNPTLFTLQPNLAPVVSVPGDGVASRRLVSHLLTLELIHLHMALKPGQNICIVLILCGINPTIYFTIQCRLGKEQSSSHTSQNCGSPAWHLVANRSVCVGYLSQGL